MQNAFVLQFSFFLCTGTLAMSQYKNALECQPHVSPGPGVLDTQRLPQLNFKDLIPP